MWTPHSHAGASAVFPRSPLPGGRRFYLQNKKRRFHSLAQMARLSGDSLAASVPKPIHKKPLSVPAFLFQLLFIFSHYYKECKTFRWVLLT